MKAAIIVESKHPLEIVDLKPATPLKYGQVLVKINYTTICGSQLGEIDAVKGPDKFLPHLLGHEGSGIVLEIGEGVKLLPGDQVICHWRKGSGIESPTPKYLWGNKTVNAGWITTFNDEAIISENRLTKMPQNMAQEIAPLYGCAITTGFGVVSNDANMKIGESILIFGVGGVGLPVIMASKLMSASKIVAVDVNNSKLEKAKLFGANQTINSLSEPLPSEQFDVVVDCTGIKSVMEKAYNLTKSNGRTILVGVPPKDDLLCIDSMPLHFEKSITGSHGGSANPTTDIPRIFSVLNSNLEEMITHKFSLEDINEGINHMREGSVIKCLIQNYC